MNAISNSFAHPNRLWNTLHTISSGNHYTVINRTLIPSLNTTWMQIWALYITYCFLTCLHYLLVFSKGLHTNPPEQFRRCLIFTIYIIPLKWTGQIICILSGKCQHYANFKPYFSTFQKQFWKLIKWHM